MAATAVSNATVRALSFEKPTNGSVIEVFKQLRLAGTDELPKDLTVGETERPTVLHDEWEGAGEIPVIDLSLLETDRAALVKQIHTAVTEWGFFQIVNHGISLETMKALQAHGYKFFELPVEVKERTRLADDGLSPYSGDCSKMCITSLFWAESLSISLNFMEKMVSQVWPEGNQEFKDKVGEFCSGAEAIGKDVFELIAEALGLPANTFSQHYEGKRQLAMRWNYYPPCPKPTDSLGAAGHTDPNCITVLLQDKVGGLQIEKDGRWIGVRPVEGALVVNIGDTLHAWSNGVCRSVVHRAVVNKEVARLSIAAFLSVHDEFSIAPPDGLIDDKHPRQYKDMMPWEYINHFSQSRHEDPNTTRNGVVYLRENFKFEK